MYINIDLDFSGKVSLYIDSSSKNSGDNTDSLILSTYVDV